MSRLLRPALLLALWIATAAPVTAQTAPSPAEPTGFEQIDGAILKPATLSYDATVEAGGRSFALSSTQTIVKTTTGGISTWTLVSRIKTPQGQQIDSLVVDRSSLLPISRHQSGRAGLNLTYTGPSASEKTKVSGTRTSRGQSVSISTTLNGPTLAGGVHDVIALSTMPLQTGFSTALRVFSPQDQTTKRAEFKVTGTDVVETPAGSFETYVVELDVGDGYVTGTVHLRKTAPHYYVKWKTEVSEGQGTRTIQQTLSSMEMNAPTPPGSK